MISGLVECCECMYIVGACCGENESSDRLVCSHWPVLESQRVDARYPTRVTKNVTIHYGR